MAKSVGARLVLGMLIAIGGSLLLAQDAGPVSVESKLAQLALEAARQGPVTPIPLDNSTDPSHGVLYDRFLLGVVAAKAALAAGRTPPTTAATPGGGFIPLAVAIVAYPRNCDGRTSAAQAVRLSARTTPATNSPIQPARVVATGAAAKALLPGVTLPLSSLVVGFATVPLTDAVVSIDYTEPLCPATLKTVDLTLHTTLARPVKMTQTAQIPADQPTLASPTTVRVQALLDRDGRVRFPTLLQGPPDLEAAATDLVKQWQFEPTRTNGVASPQVMVLPITFTTTGQPGPPVMASSTGSPLQDPTHNTTTFDVSGLNRASSRCPVSDDPTYGFSPSNPVKVGGDARLGPAREVSYLTALRGASGEGINFRRLGSTMAPDKTILDLYEVNHPGLVTPLRIYVDEYHFDELKAPSGLVCAAAFDLAIPPAGNMPSGPPASATDPTGLPPNRTVALTISDDQPSLTPATSKCPVSDDDAYALSAANAVRLGGGALAVSREDQYMTALRGPGGKGLKYRRTGSMLAPDQKTIVDVFEVSYAGTAQPVRLFFDRATDDTPKAPKGWACFQEIKK